MNRHWMCVVAAVALTACSSAGSSATGDRTATTAAATPVVILTPITSVTIPHATVEYYAIAGDTVGDLRAAMNAGGPHDQFGARYDSYTGWNYRWHVPQQPGGTCDVHAASVEYDVHVTFPEWEADASEDPAVVYQWNAYALALANHESGHAQLVADALPLVEAAIKDSDCEHYEARAQAALDALRQGDLDYDARTAHGVTQGAHFP